MYGNLEVFSFQVMCKAFPISLLNMVLVLEVGRDLGSLNSESISTLISTTDQKLLIWIYIQLEACKKWVGGRFYVQLNNIHGLKRDF